MASNPESDKLTNDTGKLSDNQVRLNPINKSYKTKSVCFESEKMKNLLRSESNIQFNVEFAN